MSQRTFSSQTISQNDITLFKAVTEVDDDTARAFLSKHPNLNSALDAFLSTSRPPLSDVFSAHNNQNLNSPQPARSSFHSSPMTQSNDISGSYKGSSQISKYKWTDKGRDSEDSMEIENEASTKKKVLKENTNKSKGNIRTADVFSFFKEITQADEDDMDYLRIANKPEEKQIVNKYLPISEKKEEKIKEEIKRKKDNLFPKIEYEAPKYEYKDDLDTRIRNYEHYEPLEKAKRKNDFVPKIEYEVPKNDYKVDKNKRSNYEDYEFSEKASDFEEEEEEENVEDGQRMEEEEEPRHIVKKEEFEYKEEEGDKESEYKEENDEKSENGEQYQETQEIEEEIPIKKEEADYIVKEESKENSNSLLTLFTNDTKTPASPITFRNFQKEPKETKEEIKPKLTPPKPTAPPQIQQINWGLPKLPYVLKSSYEDYIRPFQQKTTANKRSLPRPGSKKQEEEIPEEGWPKYLGSLLVECRFASEEYVERIQIHDQISLEADSIKFTSTNVSRGKKATKEDGKVIQKKNWHIKGNSLIVRCYWKSHYIGNLRCYNEEIFVFLLSKKFITLEGIVLDVIKDPRNNYDPDTITQNQDGKQEPGEKLRSLFATMKIPSKLKIQLNIFLTSQVLRDPLNVHITPGRKNVTKVKGKIGDYSYEKEVEDDESQKDFQILKYTKESLSRLFAMLSINVTIPPLVQVRYRSDPFKRLQKEKNGVNQFSLFGADVSSGVMPDLIMSTIPDYYKRANVKQDTREVPGFQTASKALQEKKHPIYEHIGDDSEGVDSISIEEEDEEEENARGTPGRFSQRRKYSGDSDEDFMKLQDEKVSTDLLSTSEQFSNHYVLTDPPYTFKSDLHAYQKQALSWMIYKEGCMDLKDLYDESLQEGRILSDLFQEMVLPDGSKMYFNPFNGEISNEFPKSKSCKGGILADEMGLGKTVMTIALIHSHRRKITEMEEEIIESSSDDEFGAFKIPKTNPNITKKDVLDLLGLHEGLSKGKGKKGKVTLEAKEEKKGSKGKNGKSQPIKEKSLPVRNTRSNAKKVKRDDSDDSWFGDDNKKKKEPDDNWQPEDFDEIKRETGIKRKDSFDLMGFGTADTNKGGTLIVVPLTVLSQWETEIAAHSKKRTLSVLQYYGNNRKKTRLSDYDVVLTTYGLLESEFSKQKDEPFGLFKCEWFRVILDEAHYIKARTTKTAKAAFALNAEYRWCLTGTPIQNKLDDLFALLQFLKVETWGEYFWWNAYVNNFGSMEEASKLVRGVLKQILLRRTKKSTYLDGRNILQLPKKEIKSHMVKLTAEERRIYNCFFQGSQNQFNEMVQGGTLQYEYAHIFELLVRLRQVCDHPCLVFSREDMKDQYSVESAVLKFLTKRLPNGGNANNNKAQVIKGKSKDSKGKKNAIEEEKDEERTEFVTNIIKNLKGKELEPCSICLEEITEPVITNCGHIYCQRCLTQSIQSYKKCPLCKTELSMRDMMSISLEDTSISRSLVDSTSENFRKSSKLEAVLQAIEEVALKNEKCVVFSQFIGMLNLIGRFLEEKKLQFRRIDGSITLKQRMQYIEDFKKNKEVTAFLISLRAGGVGLNLTAANHVFIVDPWWNPAAEDQAIERVHRIGQQKNVSVKRFICAKTIEERILELQGKKKELINMTLHFNPEQQKKRNMENMMHVMRGFDEDS